MRQIFSIIVLMLAVTASTPAHAAEPAAIVTLRTDIVEVINSLELASASSSVLWLNETSPIALHRIDFTVTAFTDDVLLPLAVTRGDSAAAGAEFDIETRGKGVSARGIAAGVIVPHEGTSGANRRIPKGTTERFSLLVAYADAPNATREDRVVMTGLTITTLAKVAELNPFEVESLVSPYTEFYRPQ